MVGGVLGGLVVIGIPIIDHGEPAEAPKPTEPIDPAKIQAAKDLLKAAGLTMILLCSVACAQLPKQENIDAVRTTATQLKDLSVKSEKIYTIGVEGLAKKLRQKAKESNDNWIGFLKRGELLDPTKSLTATQIEAFQVKQDELDAAADKAIDEALAAIKDHNVHAQMHDLSTWLDAWLFTHLSSEEQNAQIIKQGHDLLYTPKEIR